MRGFDAASGSLFSYVDLEARVPAQHPLRIIREVVNEVLLALDGEFAKMYAAFGRPSIAPERLLRGSLIQAFYTIRSERQLMEQLDYNLLFRWFAGLGIDDPVWDHSTYSKNRDRLLEADVARKFLKAILAHGKVAPLLSDDHFTVDGTLVQAWASMKSFVPKEPPSDTPALPPAGGSASGPPAEAKQTPEATEPEVAALSAEPSRPDPRTAPCRPQKPTTRAATRTSTSTARSGPTRRTPRARIRKRDSTAKARARKPSSLTWGMRRRRTGTASSSTPR